MTKPSDSTRRYPRLRTRQQLTIRYHEIDNELLIWRGETENARFKRFSPMHQNKVLRHIAECEAALEQLTYALNGVI